MSSDGQSLGLGEAAGGFLAKLTPSDREASQQEVYRFVRWYGRERPFTGLTAPEVANYAERLSLSDTDYAKKLELIRAFLVFAKKEGWIKTSLSTHLKAKKGKSGSAVPIKQGLPNVVTLTPQGYEELKAEIADLKSKRLEVIEDIRRAAADKDFRENAPLDAAREKKGHIEGRIMKLEETLKAVTVISEQQKPSLKVSIGRNVILSDLSSGEELCYMIVDPREVDPTHGKISLASPTGKALVGRSEGDVVEVVVPAGKLRYQIKQVAG